MSVVPKNDPQPGQGQNIVPLLEQLRKVPYDERGREIVRKAASSLPKENHLDGHQLFDLATLCQQHGLIQESLALLRQVNLRFPELKKGWQLHLETLSLLDRRAELVQVQSQARANGHADLLPAGEERIDPEATNTDHPEEVVQPFTDLRREEKNLATYLRIFQGREDAFARQWADKQEGKSGYVPVQRPLQPSDIQDHIQGKYTYGIYLLNEENQVHVGVIDADLVKSLRQPQAKKKKQAAIRREAIYLHTRLAQLAKEYGLCCLAEFSGNKGYHFWFPVRSPIAAATMRKVLAALVRKIAPDLQCFDLEVFPKQDRRTGKGFGNLVKLPLGIHRLTGKPSWFLSARSQAPEHQLEWLRQVQPTDPQAYLKLAGTIEQSTVIVHPRLQQWAKKYPELATLEQRCPPLAQIMLSVRHHKMLSTREEKVLLSTLTHLPRGRLLLHHLFSQLPEYNRPLLDYKISKVRGTVLGCKRIHSLLDMGPDLPCHLETDGYKHPLLHLDLDTSQEPRSERVTNLKDALENLKTALAIVERFL